LEKGGGLGYGGAASVLDLVSEGILVEPTVEGALADLSGAGRCGNRSCIEQGRGLLLF